MGVCFPQVLAFNRCDTGSVARLGVMWDQFFAEYSSSPHSSKAKICVIQFIVSPIMSRVLVLGSYKLGN